MRNQNTSDKPENCRVPYVDKCQLHGNKNKLKKRISKSLWSRGRTRVPIMIVQRKFKFPVGGIYPTRWEEILLYLALAKSQHFVLFGKLQQLGAKRGVQRRAARHTENQKSWFVGTRWRKWGGLGYWRDAWDLAHASLQARKDSEKEELRVLLLFSKQGK